ncbi:MAG: NINE protein [Saprospiraceae bacterium]|nr:NINE protein [Saprospiraceae bacterium]
MKKKLIAVLLAIFAGAFGVHKFYLRQPEMGIAYIALYIWLGRFFGFPFSAILAWYDAYKLMMMDEQEFDRKYNSYYFRDRYGRRRDIPKERPFQKRGKYILIDDDQPKTEKQPSNYFKNKRNKKIAETHKQAGIRKFKAYDAKGAIEEFTKALENNPTDISTHFNIACAYSVEEKGMEAFQHLEQAVSLGYQDTYHILNNEALAYIRVFPAFEMFQMNGFKLNPQIISSIKETEEKQSKEKFDLYRKVPVLLKTEAQ